MDTRFATLLVEETIRELHATAARRRLVRAARGRRPATVAEAPDLGTPVVATIARPEAPRPAQPARGD